MTVGERIRMLAPCGRCEAPTLSSSSLTVLAPVTQPLTQTSESLCCLSATANGSVRPAPLQRSSLPVCLARAM